MPFVNEHYELNKLLGEGTFGAVYAGTMKSNQTKVAIKIFKQRYPSWKECTELKEVKSILKLNPPGRPPHPNIVCLLELFRDPKERLHMVFEHMASDVLQMIENQKGVLFAEFVVQQISRQMINGLAYMHAHGFFHRDLKPENLLCDGPGIVKIADFGQAREIRARPPFTDYVSTRWYRAPEVSLGATNYNSAVDVWGVGAVIYELLTLRVLFPGTSTIDQLFKTAELIGPITEKNWSDGLTMASRNGVKFSPELERVGLASRAPKASQDALKIMFSCLLWDPLKRPRMRDLLKTHSKWLDGGRRDTLSALTGATTMAVLWSQKSHGKAEDANDDDSSSSNHAGLASAPQPSYSEDAIMEEDTMADNISLQDEDAYVAPRSVTPAQQEAEMDEDAFDRELRALEADLHMDAPTSATKKKGHRISIGSNGQSSSSLGMQLEAAAAQIDADMGSSAGYGGEPRGAGVGSGGGDKLTAAAPSSALASSSASTAAAQAVPAPTGHDLPIPKSAAAAGKDQKSSACNLL